MSVLCQKYNIDASCGQKHGEMLGRLAGMYYLCNRKQKNNIAGWSSW